MRVSQRCALLSLVAFVLSVQISLFAQMPVSIQPFASYGGGQDTINLGDLGVHNSFPILQKAGRGINFSYTLSNDSLIWQNYYNWTPSNPLYGWSATGPTGAGTGFLISTTTLEYNCGNHQQAGPQGLQYNYQFVDNMGGIHPFPTGTYTTYDCGNQTISGFPATTTDGSGVTINCPNCVNNKSVSSSPTLTLSFSNGEIVNTTGGASASVNVQDTNGNYLTSSGSLFAGFPTYTDTLGNVVMSTTDGGTTSTGQPDGQQDGTGVTTDSSATISYNAGDGNSHSFGVFTTAFEIKTAFNCNDNIEADTGPANQQSSARLITQLSLPDGTAYNFQYEPTTVGASTTTGRLASISYPQGGSVSYLYGPSNCDYTHDSAPLSLTRIIKDNLGNSSKWVYSRKVILAQDHNTPNRIQTTVTDPLLNDTVYTFVEADPEYNIVGHATINDELYFLEVSRVVYNGSSSNGQVLRTVKTCYNNAGTGYVSNCTTPCQSNGSDCYPSFPIFAKQVATTLEDGSTTSAELIQYSSQGQGLVSSDTLYDYGSGGVGPLLSRTTTTYSTALGAIVDHPSVVTRYGPQNNVLSTMTYAYDQGGVLATSNVPNHNSVTTSRGNVSSVTVAAGSLSYVSSYGHYDTGLLSSSSDTNGYTQYSYNQCGNSYLSQSVTYALSTSQTWNCIGGVPITTSDANSQTTSVTAFDLFWRPTSTTDPLGNITTTTYPSYSSNSTSVTLTYAGGLPSRSSVTTFDGLGRPILQQTSQGPGSAYTSVSSAYDPVGHLHWTSVPYSGVAGFSAYTTSGSGTTNNYDALGRILSSNDPGGGVVSYAYTLNDTLASQGPVVAGENVKARQLEYNAGGQITSVCEITGAASSGPCGQHAANNGYLTTFQYTNNLLTTVQQNVQAGAAATQTRTISYDAFGRKTSETIPETGTTRYIYGTDTTGNCGGAGSTSLTSPISVIDNIGNQTCFAYDSLSRLISSQVVAGQYASLTPQNHFVYDAATLQGTAMQNVVGRIAEAYTCVSPCTTKLTDIFASTSIQTGGRLLSQMWESSPNSNGYFLTQSITNANGALASTSSSLNGNSIGLPTIQYGLDSLGRPTSATDTSQNQYLASNTTYDSLLGRPTGVTFGNGDSDSFSTDPMTGRPVGFGYAVGGSSAFNVSGALTWNPNGSLNNFSLTDSSDSTKNQNCNYGMDDLNRLASVTCAGTWAQAMSYDAFGNIVKSTPSNWSGGGMTQSYSASYDSATNRVISGAVASYDGNGNQTIGPGAQITWNAARQAVLVNGTGRVFDALGRLVETGDAIGAVAATGDTGNIQITGSEQVHPAGQRYQVSNLTATITGAEQSKVVDPSQPSQIANCSAVRTYTSGSGSGGSGGPPQSTTYCYDGGGGTLLMLIMNTANGQVIQQIGAPITYGADSSPTTLAASIVSAINANTNITGVSTTQSGASVTFNASGVFPPNLQLLYRFIGPINSAEGFSQPSFSITLPNPVIGTNVGPAPAVPDSGTMTATIGNQTSNYVWGVNDTPASIAQGLATAINNQSSTPVSATVSGATLVVTSIATGATQPYTITASTTSNNTFMFPSFASSVKPMNEGYAAVAGSTTTGPYTQIVYMPDGSKLGTVQNGSIVSASVPLPGGVTAVYSSNGFNYFRHKDWLGSSRLATTWNHAVYSKTSYAPYGEQYNEAGTRDRSFTGQDQNASTQDYDFLYRTLDQVAGRWMSPDPAGWSVVDSTNPQSFNRYAYVLGNPMSLVDPDGQDPCAFFGGAPLATLNGCDALADLYSAESNQPPPTPTQFGQQAIAQYESYSSQTSERDEAVYVRALTDGYWTGGTDKYYDYWTGDEDYPVAPNNAAQQHTCQEQRILNAIPGSQLTGGETAQGGHEQFNIQVNSSDLTAAGFTPYTTIFGTPNGYHNGSLFLQVHVNGQNGTQLPGGSGILNVQGHIDVFNPAAGYGVGLLLHTIWDLGIGSLFFRHSAALDPGC